MDSMKRLMHKGLQRTYTCGICARNIPAAQVDAHIRSHTDDVFTCGFCLRKVTTPELDSHLDSHSALCSEFLLDNETQTFVPVQAKTVPVQAKASVQDAPIRRKSELINEENRAADTIQTEMISSCNTPSKKNAIVQTVKPSNNSRLSDYKKGQTTNAARVNSKPNEKQIFVPVQAKTSVQYAKNKPAPFRRKSEFINEGNHAADTIQTEMTSSCNTPSKKNAEVQTVKPSNNSRLSDYKKDQTTKAALVNSKPNVGSKKMVENRVNTKTSNRSYYVIEKLPKLPEQSSMNAKVTGEPLNVGDVIKHIKIPYFKDARKAGLYECSVIVDKFISFETRSTKEWENKTNNTNSSEYCADIGAIGQDPDPALDELLGTLTENLPNDIDHLDDADDPDQHHYIATPLGLQQDQVPRKVPKKNEKFVPQKVSAIEGNVDNGITCETNYQEIPVEEIKSMPKRTAKRKISDGNSQPKKKMMRRNSTFFGWKNTEMTVFFQKELKKAMVSNLSEDSSLAKYFDYVPQENQVTKPKTVQQGDPFGIGELTWEVSKSDEMILYDSNVVDAEIAKDGNSFNLDQDSTISNMNETTHKENNESDQQSQSKTENSKAILKSTDNAELETKTAADEVTEVCSPMFNDSDEEIDTDVGTTGQFDVVEDGHSLDSTQTLQNISLKLNEIEKKLLEHEESGKARTVDKQNTDHDIKIEDEIGNSMKNHTEEKFITENYCAKETLAERRAIISVDIPGNSLSEIPDTCHAGKDNYVNILDKNDIKAEDPDYSETSKEKLDENNIKREPWEDFEITINIMDEELDSLENRVSCKPETPCLNETYKASGNIMFAAECELKSEMHEKPADDIDPPNKSRPLITKEQILHSSPTLSMLDHGKLTTKTKYRRKKKSVAIALDHNYTKQLLKKTAPKDIKDNPKVLQNKQLLAAPLTQCTLNAEGSLYPALKLPTNVGLPVPVLPLHPSRVVPTQQIEVSVPFHLIPPSNDELKFVCKMCKTTLPKGTNFVEHLNMHRKQLGVNTKDETRGKESNNEKAVEKGTLEPNKGEKVEGSLELSYRENIEDSSVEPNNEKGCSESVFRCQICDVVFHEMLELNRHMINTHDKNAIFQHYFKKYGTYVCVHCGKCNASLELLQLHRRINDCLNKQAASKCIWVCLYCAVIVFDTEIKMLDHATNCSFGPQQKCNLCLYTYRSDEMIDEHMVRVHAIVNLQCGHCSKAFKKYSKLQHHVAQHKLQTKLTGSGKNNEQEGGTEVKCEACEEIYIDKYSLDIHKQSCHETLEHIYIPKMNKATIEKYRTPVRSEDILKDTIKTLHDHTYIELETARHINDTQNINGSRVEENTCAGAMPVISEVMNTVEVHTQNDHETSKNRSDLVSEPTTEEDNKEIPACSEEANNDAVILVGLDCKADFKCRYCHRSFGYKLEMLRHANSTCRSKPKLKCDLCDYQSTTKNCMGRHKYKVHKIRSSKCDLCDRSYMNSLGVRKHKAVFHAKESAFFCEKCGQSFQYQHAYDWHIKIHHEGFRFKCKYCSSEFHTKMLWKIHENAHKGSFEYFCVSCQNSFLSPGHYKTHMKNKHNIDGRTAIAMKKKAKDLMKELCPNVCKICNEIFPFEAMYFQHMLSEHNMSKVEAEKEREATLLTKKNIYPKTVTEKSHFHDESRGEGKPEDTLVSESEFGSEIYTKEGAVCGSTL